MIEQDLFENMPPVRVGSVLISEPFLKDPNFDRTVVLICKHGEEGTFGLVLNRPVDLKLGDISEDFKSVKNKVYVGGPVQQNTLHFLHRLNEDDFQDTTKICEGLYWGGSFESLKMGLIQGKLAPENIRFYLGYSGWDAGQLDEEIDQRSWFVADLKDSSFFNVGPEYLWRHVLAQMGGGYRMVSNYPHDPRLN